MTNEIEKSVNGTVQQESVVEQRNAIFSPLQKGKKEYDREDVEVTI